MNEPEARAVRRMQALESQAVADSGWTEADRARASEAARREVGTSAAAQRYIVARAKQVDAMRGTPPRRELRGWLGSPTAMLLVLLLGIASGLAADAAGPDQRIDLLSPPWLALLLWNLLTYLVLSFRSLRPRPVPRDGLDTLDTTRIERLLHLGALALALGLCIGLYARGLVLDYRAGWQSTFLDATQVHGLLQFALAPASLLSGLHVPDVDTIASLREGPDGPTATAASAALWIHLFALTLLLVVIVPRALLALLTGWRVQQLAGDVALNLSTPYFQRLAREGADPHAPVAATVIPYAIEIDATAQTALDAALASALGSPVRLELQPTVVFGSEDAFALAAPIAASGSAAFVLFALAATPEREHHGTLLSLIAAKLAPARLRGVLIDESTFRQRFAADPQRIEQRRAAWVALLLEHGIAPAFIDLTPTAATGARR
jgi:hypothetical protein